MEDGKKLDLYRWPFSFFPNLRTDEVVDAWPACINHQTTPFINGNQTFLFCFCCLG
ncbi:Uncharacterized protein APZ42_027169 [Daphnia magna]|uniref:Uncharacterized protein n=1 Tax=Daphnia magna TaxID=35525 RepID=A0A164RBX2_9CRUS|nr:Uncharacterized protein APZ42_027169 [Daphnia magna]